LGFAPTFFATKLLGLAATVGAASEFDAALFAVADVREFVGDIDRRRGWVGLDER
jgi:hypothetical protein